MRNHHHRHISQLERVIRCRRNAVVGIAFGLAGSSFGVCLVLFPSLIFADHANEVVLGILVFLCGYAATLTGCGYWAKAKGWSEAIVLIGLMPLAVFFIPFVRLLVLAAPGLLSASMVMMPLVLVVVVMVLPDKSGVSRRRPSWEREQTDSLGSVTAGGASAGNRLQAGATAGVRGKAADD